MLKLQHLTKRFGTAPLFTDLCMEVDAPVVLWAPSGWGKTTPVSYTHLDVYKRQPSSTAKRPPLPRTAWQASIKPARSWG